MSLIRQFDAGSVPQLTLAADLEARYRQPPELSPAIHVSYRALEDNLWQTVAIAIQEQLLSPENFYKEPRPFFATGHAPGNIYAPAGLLEALKDNPIAPGRPGCNTSTDVDLLYASSGAVTTWFIAHDNAAIWYLLLDGEATLICATSTGASMSAAKSRYRNRH